jgi:hypothetical protein
MGSQEHERLAQPTRLPWQLENARWLFLVSNDTSQSVPQLRWWWRAIGKTGVIWDDNDRFTSLHECESDAATHGFNGVRA